MCSGKEYARLKILIFMQNLVKSFKWKKLIQDENIIVDFVHSCKQPLNSSLSPQILKHVIYIRLNQHKCVFSTVFSSYIELYTCEK